MIPGFVRLSVTGEQRERFLNLCKSRGIMFRRIVQTGEKELLLTMRVKDFFLIGPLRRKTGVHIHILKKRGPVFFLLACRRNKLLPAGVLMVIGVLFFLSGRVWNIHIEKKASVVEYSKRRSTAMHWQKRCGGSFRKLPGYRQNFPGPG